MAHAKLPETGIDTTLLVPEASTAPGSFRSAAQITEDEREAADASPALVDIPGTRAHTERDVAEAQQSTLGNVVDGVLEFTAVAPIYRKIKDEGWTGLVGLREDADGYDKREFAKNADPRLDRHMIDDIQDEPNLPAAMRAHQRYVDELDRQERMAVQMPGSGLAHLVGAFLDIDAPLFLASGGAYGAAKVTQKTIKLSQRMGLTYKAGERLASTVAGINAGVQGGALVGVGEFTTKETATWENLAAILLASTILGGTLGGVANTGKRLHAIEAEKEFLDRVRRDDPNLKETPDIDNGLNSNETVAPDEVNLFTAKGDETEPVQNVFSDPETGATVIGGEQPRSLGAAATGTGGRPQRVLNDPLGPIGREEAEIIDRTDRIRYESGFLEKKQELARSAWTKLAHSKLGRFGVDNFVRLYESQSSTLNFLSSHVFESASGIGRGRATASVIMDNFHRRIQTHIGDKINPLMHKWATENNSSFLGSGYNISSAGKRAFNRELMLEMSDRAMGRTSRRNRHVVEAADNYEAAGKEAFKIGKGEAGQHAVDGFEHLPERRGYNPYRWDGASIEALLANGVRRLDLEEAMAAGYRSAGMDLGKDANKVAKAVIHRALARENDLDSSVFTLLSGDGREFMAESLRMSGLNDAEVKNLMTRLVGSVEDRAKEGFAKSRNEIDLGIAVKNSKGEDIKLVDMMEQDMHRTWQRYSRQMSGAAALARQGITNRAQRSTFIKAAQAEQRALGEEVMETDLLQAMFSHFNAGPTHGFFDGVTNVGVGQFVATAKRLANLGLLEKLGITQLGETGAIIGQVGARNFYRRGPMVLWDKQMREANRVLLKDVAYVTGDIGRDQTYFAEWFDMDDVSNNAKNSWLKRVSALSSNGAFVQSYTSAFNHVRKYQQQIATLGMIDKVMRTLKEGDYETMLTRFEDDFGLGRAELDGIQRMVDDGLITFHPEGHVKELNLKDWNPKLRETFGASMARNMNQTVQKSLAGEQDAWMHTGWGSVMTHLMTFPMQAFQKQFIRNARHLDMQGFAAISFGMATAMIAVNVRDVIDGRDRSQTDRSVAAFTYNNMTGWIPMVTDPAMTIMGLEDYRINPFGHHASVVPPVFTQADSLRRAPGALLTAAAGEPDYYDMQALKALPFAGTYFASRIFN